MNRTDREVFGVLIWVLSLHIEYIDISPGHETGSLEKKTQPSIRE